MTDPELRPQPGRQTMFLQSNADIAIYGGAAGGGKTFGLLLEPLYHIHVPGFGAILFRQTYPQITNKGGLWDESFEIYPHVQPRPTPRAGSLEWVFASGASVGFRHMDRDETTLDFMGSQIPLIGWDQLEQFTEAQFFFMLSRNRSACGVRPYIRATTNPQPGWLADFLAWWIDEDGYANMDRIGRLRYFVRTNNAIEWADDPDTLRKRFGGVDVQPKSVTFIPASIFDNPILIKQNPGYLASLMSLPDVERLRLLGDAHRGGNWKVRQGGRTFKREWFEVVEQAPAEHDGAVRYWDMAATEPAKGKDPDWTAGALVTVHRGVFYVHDVRRTRATPLNVERFIRNAALQDGFEIPVRMEMEGGSSGKALIDAYARGPMIGFNFRGVSPTGSKEARALPSSAAAEAGNVKLVRGPWNTAFLNEIESFSPSCEHDDQVDAFTGAFNELARGAQARISAEGDRGRMAQRVDAQIEKLLAEMTPEERIAAGELLKQV